MVKEINNLSEFEQEVKQGTTLVDFYASWCGPCRMLSPVIDEVEQQNLTNAKFIKVNVDLASQIAMRFGVQVIPTLVLLKDGKEAKRSVGYIPKAKVVSFINE